MARIPNVSFNSDGQTIPVIGMGTASDPQVPEETTKEAVLEAIRSGYRHFDTAACYGSEKGLGEGLVEALRIGIIKSRDELFITSKLFCTSAERHLVVLAIQATLRNLQLNYLDLYLIHIPLKMSNDIHQYQYPYPKELIAPMDVRAVWEGMEECKILSLTKAIGISNFSQKRIEDLLAFAKIPPAVNQVEMSPLWQQKKLREFCKGKGIHITAYSSLGAIGTKWGHNQIVESGVIEEIAKSKGKTTAQIALRWVYEQGVSFVAKSFNKERMKQNIEIFDFSLTEEESEKISLLPQRKAVRFSDLIGPHDPILQLDAELDS